MRRRPGGELAARPLHIIFVADCSGSMASAGKIQALNQAVREALPHLVKVASENPHAEVLLRAISFDDSARWHHAIPTKARDFSWTDLSPRGSTAMGRAMRLLADALDVEQMSSRALPPVLILLSDGQPTDAFGAELTNFEKQPWSRKAVRLSIAIGSDADHGPLQRFIGNDELPVLQANNPQDLVHYIRWASTAVIQAVSSPTSRVAGTSTSRNVDLGEIPTSLPENDDVW